MYYTLFAENEIFYMGFLFIVASLFFILSHKSGRWWFGLLSAFTIFALILKIHTDPVMLIVFIGVFIFILIDTFMLSKENI